MKSSRFQKCLFFLAFVLVFSSCSTMNRVGANLSSDLVYHSGESILRYPHYSNAEEGMPGNLLFVEGLHSQSPLNLNLLATLNKGYVGQAFAFDETRKLDEEWGQKKSDVGLKNALMNYTRALEFGSKYLSEKEVALEELKSNLNDQDAIFKLLSNKLDHQSERDLQVVLFTAQALAALINLQKTDIKLVAELPLAHNLFSWVCKHRPTINYGACQIFFAAYEAGRPKMLGGNPDKGKEIFLKAIKDYPHNWLIRVAYIQFYLLPQNDEEGFKKEMEILGQYKEKFERRYIYSGDFNSTSFNGKNDEEWSSEENGMNRLRFYQALAIRRYDLIKQYEQSFF